MKCNIACFLFKHCSADYVIRVIILFSGIRLWLSVGKRNLRKGQRSSGFVLRLKNSFMTERFVRNISLCLVLFFISELLSFILVEISVIILLKKKVTLRVCSIEFKTLWVRKLEKLRDFCALAESSVLISDLALWRFRLWVICTRAVLVGTLMFFPRRISCLKPNLETLFDL